MSRCREWVPQLHSMGAPLTTYSRLFFAASSKSLAACASFLASCSFFPCTAAADFLTASVSIPARQESAYLSNAKIAAAPAFCLSRKRLSSCRVASLTSGMPCRSIFPFTPSSSSRRSNSLCFSRSISSPT